ncbi:DNA replication/repair protein RecF [Thiocapsa bogorovii]|uniref:DNA replication/repair protein RecF n=1 Tax=Thiocapsa bogorovii TaxID=521689 RepID=UPI001E5E5FD2|nr:DNA replication and repair protein RecF [Thiocapsa bogorovii]UHD18846.1 DNA replication and repair protein RecF [Thiocapsa bogorovii]
MDGLIGPRLLRLGVTNLRNLRSVDLDLRKESHRILLTGANGAGKTTFLEAVYLLSRGRSFRGRKAGSLTTDGETRTLIEGVFREADSSGESTLVFERSRRGSLRRYNGVAMGSLPPSDSPLRVKLVGENPQALLEGEPMLRRGLLDWNVFHVEHRLGRLRADLRRVLAQRNAALRHAGSGVSIWDPTFVQLSARITEKREAFVDLWRTQFRSLANHFSFLDDFELVFERGWPRDSDLTEILEQGRSADIQRGQTLAGAHRADIGISRDRAPPRLSRGQAKVAVCLLQLAAERVHRGKGLAPSLWLLDDIDAELDTATGDRLWRLFEEAEGQRMVARLGYHPTEIKDGSIHQDTMFHVEQGIVTSAAVADRPPPPTSLP